jgi:CubicO group peptidase (beta-lactamase class C family)
MTHLRRALVNTLAVVSLAAIPLLPMRLAAQPVVSPAAAAAIDSLFAAHDRPDVPGYVLGVVKDGQLVFSRAYGSASLEHGVPLTTRSVFHLASLSKQFTGAAVALLALEGRISLDDPVARYVPEAAKYGDALRIEHLVYMTSGIHEYTDIPRANGLPWQSFHYFTVDEAIAAALRPDTLAFAPGTAWRYTNSNYMLLARIVEAASGMPFATFMEERLLRPLGMNGSRLSDDATLVIPNRVSSYAPRSDGMRQEAATLGVQVRGGTGWLHVARNSPHYGGSGVMSSLEDLVRWDENFHSQRVGGPGFTEFMQRRMRFAHPKENDAVGLVRSERYGREFFDYAGGDLDASTYMGRFPAERLTVICLSNMPTGRAEHLGRQVLDILHTHGAI